MQLYGVGSTSNSGGSVPQNESIASQQDFLRLFLIQLQHQDPLDPVKDHDFIAQMAQFSQLEEVQKVNNNLSDLKEMFHAIWDFNGSMELLGREVYGETETGPVSGFVEGITYSEGRPTLVVDGQLLPLGHVKEIRLGQSLDGGDEGE